MAAASPQPLRIVVVPWLAFGHLLPYLELAERLASRGHRVSYVSTPRNLARLPPLRPASAPQVDLVALPLPRVDGLPDGAESTNDIPDEDRELHWKAFDGLAVPFAEFMAAACADEGTRPHWIIADTFHHRVAASAAEHKEACIPLKVNQLRIDTVAKEAWLKEALSKDVMLVKLLGILYVYDSNKDAVDIVLKDGTGEIQTHVGKQLIKAENEGRFEISDRTQTILFAEVSWVNGLLALKRLESRISKDQDAVIRHDLDVVNYLLGFEKELYIDGDDTVSTKLPKKLRHYSILAPPPSPVSVEDENSEGLAAVAVGVVLPLHRTTMSIVSELLSRNGAICTTTEEIDLPFFLGTAHLTPYMYDIAVLGEYFYSDSMTR